MVRIFSFLFLGIFSFFVFPFFVYSDGVPDWRSYNPFLERSTDFQYFTPSQSSFFCGDPMPFFHDSVFHVYWLLDRGHSFDPLGGHVWAHSSSRDLKEWVHYPIALGLDSTRERSMCTGSVFFHDGCYYAFYAERRADSLLGKREVIGVAVSEDGVRFKKGGADSFWGAPEGFAFSDLRDPFVFEFGGHFYMVVTAYSTDCVFEHEAACLIYYESDDLRSWRFKGRFYTPGSADGFAHAECSDLFRLGDFYYLLFKINGGTFYRVSDSPFGPWRSVGCDNIGCDYALVFKSADFHGRRIAVGFIPWREGERDSGGWQYGGSLVFRELRGNEDGSLGACFVEEMLPDGEVVVPDVVNCSGGAKRVCDSVFSVVSVGGFGALRLGGVSENCRISFRVVPSDGYTEAGVLLRDEGRGRHYYDLRFIPKSNKVFAGSCFIDDCDGLSEPFTVDVVMRGSVLDVCVNGRRCLTNRVFDYHGDFLTFYVRDGAVNIEGLKVVVF